SPSGTTTGSPTVNPIEERNETSSGPVSSSYTPAAALLEGIRAVYAEVPTGVRESVVRRLAALARSRRSALLLRPLGGDLPTGVAYVRYQGREVTWEGPDAGHGRLEGRRLMLEASGKGMSGIERVIEVEDDGADVVRMVSRLAVAPAGRAAG
ncbi:MAG: hypothetical protein ACXW1Y_13310, partial [Acidimicrobiia bacterium]